MAHMRLALAATLALSLAGSFTAGAQQSDTPFKPVETPKLDPDVFKAPQAAAPDQVTATNNALGNGTQKSPTPGGVAIGKYDKFELNFDAARTKDINPRTGFDSGETSNLSKSLDRRKTGPAMPDYFGLKLTAPTQ